MRRWPLMVAAGCVAATVIGVIVAVVVSGGRTTHADGSAAREFTAAWRRSREGTWTATGDDRQASVSSGVKVVQRPPDRLTRIGGSVVGRVNGRNVSCVVDPQGTERCHDGGPALDYRLEIDQEVSRLVEQVGGPSPLYLVTRSGAGCFELRLATAIAAPPYGTQATFCFAPDTGAPTLLAQSRQGIASAQRFTTVHAAVDNADLVLPAPLEP